MEFCFGGSLFGLICRLPVPLLVENPISNARCWMIVRSVVKGVYFLHSKRVVHRDLKLENVLITSSTENGITTEQVWSSCFSIH